MEEGSSSSPATQILQKLLSILKVDFKLPEHFHLHLSLLSGNQKTQIIEQTINLNPDRFSDEESKIFLEYIRKLRESRDDYLLMDRKSYEVVKELYALNPDFQDIEKLQDVLPPDDYLALEGAVYIKYLGDNGRYPEISERKKQIRYLYGARGNDIANLYSAGYFHGIFFPLYAVLVKEPDGIQEFRLVFDKLIRDFPLAIFINHNMNKEEVKSEIKKKVDRNLKYGIRKLHIHGINKSNCDNIKDAVKELQDEGALNLMKPPEISEISSILLATLEF